MVYTCYVCKWNGNKVPKRTFHKFPVDANLRKTWLDIIGKPDAVIGTRTTVCSVHFDKDCFRYGLVRGRQLLKDRSVPSLHLLTKTDCHGGNGSSLSTCQQDLSVLTSSLSQPAQQSARSKLTGELNSDSLYTLSEPTEQSARSKLTSEQNSRNSLSGPTMDQSLSTERTSTIEQFSSSPSCSFQPRTVKALRPTKRVGQELAVTNAKKILCFKAINQDELTHFHPTDIAKQLVYLKEEVLKQKRAVLSLKRVNRRLRQSKSIARAKHLMIKSLLQAELGKCKAENKALKAIVINRRS